MDVYFSEVFLIHHTSSAPSAYHIYYVLSGESLLVPQNNAAHHPGMFRDRKLRVHSYHSIRQPRHLLPNHGIRFPTIPVLWGWYNPEIGNGPAIHTLPYSSRLPDGKSIYFLYPR